MYNKWETQQTTELSNLLINPVVVAVMVTAATVWDMVTEIMAVTAWDTEKYLLAVSKVCIKNKKGAGGFSLALYFISVGEIMEIYLDYAASTPVAPEVWQEIEKCNKFFANPSSPNSMGQKSRELIENARDIIAKSINAKNNEIIFCGTGTEANNLAIQGFINNYNDKIPHIITTQIEHKSVLNPIKYLEDCDCDVTYLPVNNDGLINLQQLQRSIRRNTVLISIMFANNEIGTIQPIQKIGEIARQYDICFHTDAIQAFGHCDINVKKLNIDLMSISGHKIYAPKGVGVLYAKNDIELVPLVHGAGQEFGLRSGTENVNSIVGLGKAIELLNKTEINNITTHLVALKNKFIDGIKTTIPNVKINSPLENSLPNIVNLSFEGVDASKLLKALDSNNIYVSNRLETSYVLDAIGVSDDLIHSSLRFSFSKYNNETDIDHILNVLPDLVKELRKEA